MSEVAEEEEGGLLEVTEEGLESNMGLKGGCLVEGSWDRLWGGGFGGLWSVVSEPPEGGGSMPEL